MVGSPLAAVRPHPLLVVLAALFVGLSVVLVATAAVTGAPLALMAAVPLAITGLLMWYQGTGRLTATAFRGGAGRHRRRHGRRSTVGPTGGRGGGADEGEPWADPFWEEVEREARTRSRRRAQRRQRRRRTGRAEAAGPSAGERPGSDHGTRWDDVAGARGRRRSGERTRAHDPAVGGLTAAEAYDVLGLDGPAGEDAVRDAYREKAKVLHPDTDGGSAEAFQELQAAYERLVGERA